MNMRPLLTDRFARALVFAAGIHRAQTRKGTGIPYVSHVLAVASLVLEHGADEDQAIAALLHDAIEDAADPAAARREIRERFGSEVVRLVDGCTDSDVQPKPPWRARKEAYLTHLRGAPADVRLVSAADKLHNARAILSDYQRLGEALWERFTGGREGTLWYYRALVDALGSTGRSALVEELARTVEELERAARRSPGRGRALSE